jgi:hypothetical protein
MMGANLDRIGTSSARRHVQQVAYERGVKDGLARTPVAIDPTLAGSAPGLARAYGDGYQWGTRHRPRNSSFLEKLGLGRRI